MRRAGPRVDAPASGDEPSAASATALGGPSITPWKKRSIYHAAGTTTSVPSVPSAMSRRNAPRKARNSPAKLLRPGKPSAESAAIRNTVASQGSRAASPPKSASRREPVRASMYPAIRNRAAMMMP